METRESGMLTGSAERVAVNSVAASTGWLRVIGVGLGVTLLIGVLVTVFAWPATNTEPRNVPIAVVGPSEAQEQAQALAGDSFDPRPIADADAARQLIRDREVYGAIVYQPDGPPQLMNSSAASPAVARIIQGIGETISLQIDGERSIQVEDVVPLTEGDPNGAGFIAATLPMVMGGLIAGIAMSFVVSGLWMRWVGAIVSAIGGGLVVTFVVQSWLGSLSGDFLVNAGAITLTILAIATTLIGLYSLIGQAGIGLVAATFFLLGNPLSSAASAPEMLPSGWGTLGQLLPAGASVTLLRSTAFFDGSGAAAPVLVLSGWLIFGLLMIAVAWRFRPSKQNAVIA